MLAILVWWQCPAQDQGRSPNFIDNLFGNNNAPPPAAGRPDGQADDADLTVQINQLQGQIRQLTGTIEQLQYRNQQLEQQVRALQGNSAAGPGPGAGPGAIASPAYPATQQQPRGMQQNYPSAAQQNYPPPVITAARPPLRRVRRTKSTRPARPCLGSLDQPPDYPAARTPIGARRPRAGARRRPRPAPAAERGPCCRLPSAQSNATGSAQLASVAPPSATR